MKIGRRRSGIPGLDSMITGGFPVPSTVLIAGEPGTGKTTFVVQFLFSGAAAGEDALYVTAISEPQWVVQKFLSEFKFFDQSAIDDGRIVFADIGALIMDDPDKLLEHLTSLVEQHSPKRLVIDPITPIKEILDLSGNTRKFLHDFISYTKPLDCVTLITGEFSYEELSANLESYMVDGIVMLSYPEEERVRRKYVEVMKMRGTKHVTGRQLIDITPGGLAVQAGLR